MVTLALPKISISQFLRFLLGASLSITLSHTCILCPLSIPNRPRPLDQFRLPSIEKIIETSDAIQELCRNGNRSNSSRLSEGCQKDVAHLFCSLTELVEYYKSDCPGAEDRLGCQQCRKRSAALYKRNSWILTWVDSVGKMPSGISDGNYHWLGDYEQCLELKEQAHFNGRYCLLHFQVPDVAPTANECVDDGGLLDPLEVNLGICLPAGCEDKELETLVKDVAKHEITVHCESKTKLSWSAIIFLSISALWVMAIAVATLLFWIREGKNQRASHLVYSLCIQENLRHSLHVPQLTIHSYSAPLDSKVHQFPQLWEPLHYHSVHVEVAEGLEVLSAVLLILGNWFYFVMPYLENVGSFYALADSAIAQPIVNYSHHADALLALLAFKLASTHSAHLSPLSNVLKLLLKWTLRAWPVYAYIIGFITLLHVNVGEGPMWGHNDLTERCSSSWLTNLLLVNTYFGYTKTCLEGGFLWALAAHFLLFSVILMYWREKRAGMKATINAMYSTILLMALMLSFLYTFGISYLFVGGGVPTLLPTLKQFSSHNPLRKELHFGYANWLYLSMIARAAPFALGLLAYEHKLHLRRILPLTLPLYAAAAIYVTWGPHFLTQYFHGDEILSAVYASTHRIVWSAATLLLVFYLGDNSSSALTAVLSWRAFHPLSKLALLVYLLSEPVALSLFSSLHRPIYATPLSTVLSCLGTVVCSYFIAFTLDTLISRPLSSLLTSDEEERKTSHER